MQRITTTIKRDWLVAIFEGKKKIEYREIKPYWTKKLAGLTKPFELHLVNGRRKNVPTITLLIHKVTANRRLQVYELHIKHIVGFTIHSSDVEAVAKLLW